MLKKLFPGAKTEVQNDLLAAARASLRQRQRCCLHSSTGANSCFFNGKKMVKTVRDSVMSSATKGSGAYLGKKVIQYYLYNTYDEELKARFEKRFQTTPMEILENVYKKTIGQQVPRLFRHFPG